MIRSLFTCATLTLLLALAACGGGGEDYPDDTTQQQEDAPRPIGPQTCTVQPNGSCR